MLIEGFRRTTDLGDHRKLLGLGMDEKTLAVPTVREELR